MERTEIGRNNDRWNKAKKMEQIDMLVKSFFMFHGYYAELKNNYKEFLEKAVENFETKVSEMFEIPEKLIMYTDWSEEARTYRWEFRDSERRLLFHLPAITDQGYFVINGEAKVMLITEMRLRSSWYLTRNDSTISCQCCINNSNMPVIIELLNSSTLQINLGMIYKDVERIANEDNSDYEIIKHVSMYSYLTDMLKFEDNYLQTVAESICTDISGSVDEDIFRTCMAIIFSAKEDEETITDVDATGYVIKKKLFAGMSDEHIMYTVLGMSICCIGVMLDKCRLSDRDDYSLKRLCTPGETIYEMFKRCVIIALKECNKVPSKNKEKERERMKVLPRKKGNQGKRQHEREVNQGEVAQLGMFLRKLQSLIDQSVYTCLKRGEQVIAGTKYSKMAVQLSKRSIIDSISSVRRVQIPCDENSQNTVMRQIHQSQKGYICPCETPEGKPVGLIKHLAACCLISGPCDNIYELLSALNIVGVEFLGSSAPTRGILVNVDGAVVGWCSIQDALEWIETVKGANPFVSCSIEAGFIKMLMVRSGAGRPLMPVIKTKKNIKTTKACCPSVDAWRELVNNRQILYVDPVEYKNKIMFIELLHPCLMLGLTASLIPFPEHNQSSRNVFACAMIKQALQSGKTAGKTSDYLQKPLVSTLVSRAIGYDDSPYGLNLLTCIMSYTGFNQEDAIIVKRSSIDRGMFDYVVYKDEELTVEKPYEMFIGDDGIVSVLSGGAEQELQHAEPMLSRPVFVECNEIQLENKRWKLVIRYKEHRNLQLGDKLSSRHAQKGVIGLIANEEDMPFNCQGIVPDIIINPHAIPSRMTVGQLLEGVLGMDCCKKFNVNLEDGTPFLMRDKKSIEELLSLTSTEKMTLGTTGQQVQGAVVMGMVYYMSLAHQSADKIYVRGAGWS